MKRGGGLGGKGRTGGGRGRREIDDMIRERRGHF